MNDRPALLGGPSVRTAPWPDWPVYGPAEEQALLRTLRSGKWGKLDGSEVTTFEERFAEYIGVKHAIAVVNGTVLRDHTLAAWVRESGYGSCEVLGIEHPFWKFHRLG